MITLFRFEDTYGMYTVFTQFNKVPQNVGINTISRVSDDLYLMRGCSSQSMFSLTARSLDFCKRCGIERVVFVFDADNEHGIKSDIMSISWLSTAINQFLRDVNKIGWSVKSEFCLTSYSAETILLYQTVKNLSISVEDIVNEINTNKFQLRLLGSQYGIFNDKKIKNSLETYLDATKLVKGNSSLNRDVIAWVQSGCDIAFRHMNLDSVIEKLRKTHRVFNINKSLVHEFLLSSEVNSKSFLTNSQVSPSDLLTSVMANFR